MDIGFLLIFLALFLLVGLFVSRPLFEDRSVSVSEAEHRFSELLAERDRILDSIRELDMDNAMGKISPEVYASQRSTLVQHGAGLIRQLDELQGANPRLEADRHLDSALEPQPAGGGEIPGEFPAAVEFDYDLENLVSARRQSRSGKAAGFCPKCGHPIQENDRFCAHCGATI